MREDYGSLTLPHHDEGFGDLEFNEDGPELLREHTEGHSNNLFGESTNSFGENLHRGSKDDSSMMGAVDDGFGAPLGQDMMGKRFKISNSKERIPVLCMICAKY